MKFYNWLSKPEASKIAIKDKRGNVTGYRPLSPRMQLHHHRVTSAILEKAVKWQYIKENLARRVEPPKVPYKETSYLDEFQTKELISLLEKECQPYRTICLLLLWTGCRRRRTYGIRMERY